MPGTESLQAGRFSSTFSVLLGCECTRIRSWRLTGVVCDYSGNAASSEGVDREPLPQPGADGELQGAPGQPHVCPHG